MNGTGGSYLITDTAIIVKPITEATDNGIVNTEAAGAGKKRTSRNGNSTGGQLDDDNTSVG